MKIQLIALTTLTVFSAVAVDSSSLRFDFGGGKPQRGFTAASPTNIYSDAMGFGFEPGASFVSGGSCIASEKPFLFSVKLPEGNYAVTVVFGDPVAASDNTVKAEMRRLMLEQIKIAKGETAKRKFTVNVRTPKITEGRAVGLKQREKDNEMVNWDDRLTLEFNGPRPALRSLEIEPVQVPTVFLVGDSTVCDQPREPWNSWGQMLPRFFGPGVAVANHAQSGESIGSSLSARRFEKVFSQMKSNDWLFVQFGHNDMKSKATNALAVYKSNLSKIVAQTRERGATPVLVTSMERKGGLERDTLGGYPDAVRAVAKDDGVALIDLHAMSKEFYRGLGANLDKAFQDGTHHNNYGSYQLARCIVEGIRINAPALAKFLADDAGKFDPGQPDAPDQFTVAASAAVDTRKPDGN